MSTALKTGDNREPPRSPPPPLYPACVTSIPLLPRDEGTVVFNERYGIAVVYRRGLYRVIDVLGRQPEMVTDEARDARLHAARRWPQAYWSRRVGSPALFAELRRVAREFDISDRLQ